MDSYLLPPGNIQIAFSGGRTSAYMLHRILEANGGLPDRAKVIFTNTGREMPETLDFVADVGREFSVHITWLEYAYDNGPRAIEVNHNSANGDGKPFKTLIHRKQYLPNQSAKFCTQELKLRTAKRWLVSQGWKEWTTATGIRADEPDRHIEPDAPPIERAKTWQPLVADGVGKLDVKKFWDAQAFDLGLENANGKTPLGNCDLCFLKSEKTLAYMLIKYPERAAWWIEQESLIAEKTNKSGATFSKRFSYAGLQEFMADHGEGLLGIDGALCQKDEGECT